MSAQTKKVLLIAAVAFGTMVVANKVANRFPTVRALIS